MYYLDTSLLVAAIWEEEGSTARVQTWMREVDGPFAISDWSLSEFAAAISSKTRAGAMFVEQRDAAELWLQNFTIRSAELLAVQRAAFRRAASIAKSPGVKVRAGDALHLAIAERHGAVICTLDKDQAAAGQAIAMGTLLV